MAGGYEQWESLSFLCQQEGMEEGKGGHADENGYEW